MGLKKAANKLVITSLPEPKTTYKSGKIVFMMSFITVKFGGTFLRSNCELFDVSSL